MGLKFRQIVFQINIIASALLLLVACTDNDKVIISADSVILAFGDSLTKGVGTDNGNDYPSQLQQILGVNVINAGVSGQTSTQALLRYNKELDSYRPDLVVICIGGNDLLRRQSLTQLDNNLRIMLQQAQARNIAVLLVAVPKPSLVLSPLELYADLADEYNVVVEQFTLSELLSHNRYKSDSVHLNAHGYHQLANAIAAKIIIQ